MQPNQRKAASKKNYYSSILFGVVGLGLAAYQYLQKETFSPAAVLFLTFGIVFYYRSRRLGR